MNNSVSHFPNAGGMRASRSHAPDFRSFSEDDWSKFVVAMTPDEARFAARSPYLPASYFTEFTSYPDSAVREAMASRIGSDARVIGPLLQRDSDRDVLIALAMNEHMPQAVLERLSRHRDSLVAEIAGRTL